MAPALCPRLRNNGFCPDRACRFGHTPYICKNCGVFAVSERVLKSHLASERHRRRVGLLCCPICPGNPMHPAHWQAHQAGQPHRRRAAQERVAPNIDPIPANDHSRPEMAGHIRCTICHLDLQQRFWPQHVVGNRHKQREKIAAFQAAIEEGEKNKNGVTITSHGDFGVVDIAAAIAGISAHLLIETTVPGACMTIVDAKLGSVNGTSTSSPFRVQLRGGANQRLVRNSPVRLEVAFRQRHLGRYEDRVDIVFDDAQAKQQFVIARPLRAIIGDRRDYELLRPRAPYVPRTQGRREPETEVVPGEAPESTNAIPWVVRLLRADIPKPLLTTLSDASSTDIMRNLRRVHLPPALTSETYSRHFTSLLWVEEHQMTQDLEKYDMSEVTLTGHGRFYYLPVPGLAENRPSVLVGDNILVQQQGANSGRWFEGYVHFVRQMEVGLRFHSSFSATPAQRFNVRFQLNRNPLRRQHQAMNVAFSPPRILFPSSRHPPSGMRPIDAPLHPINPLIANNPPQMQAVKSILRRPPGSVPFVVFGPPGTGKTVTVVEAIAQILRRQPDAHILACAPSNSAADLIAQRLVALNERPFRFYAPSRAKNAVPDDLLRYSSFNDAGTFSCPRIAVLKNYRIIVSTCISSSFAYGVGMARGHFSHIFIDEAGQATEPEVMTPIKTMAGTSTNIVLSGDHQQLGPIIRSKFACALGLETSYLERLMKTDLYHENNGHGITMVKLVKNFRSHEAILKFPNERFYNGDLQQCGDPRTINFFLESPLLASRNFPIVFHAIHGKDDREATSPSFFNIDEVSLVKDYVRMLRADRRLRITDNDIGVITPYHAQCQKIRTALRAVADSVKVGSVEEFQGQERLVIIISTVRSSRDFVAYDLRHTLGFVASPRRFNVSITRAKALLVIVGDPSVLSLDPLWRSFMNYVHNNGGWKGPGPSWDPSEPVQDGEDYARGFQELGVANMNNLTRLMGTVALAGVQGDEHDDSTHVDRPWREVE